MIRVNTKAQLSVCLFAVAAIFGGDVYAGPADEETGKALVGAWERDGKVTKFAADGTGKNHDGSRFRWELKRGRLIVRARAAHGKLGEEWSVPIAFTRDDKEYSYLLGGEDGGLRRITWYKLDAQGRRHADRSRNDRTYPPDAEALKSEGPAEGDRDCPPPSVSTSRP